MAKLDQITRDLMRKAADDATQAVLRTISLHPDQDAKIRIAVSAAGAALGLAAGMIEARHNYSPGKAVRELLEMLRPLLVDAIADAVDQEARNRPS